MISNDQMPTFTAFIERCLLPWQGQNTCSWFLAPTFILLLPTQRSISVPPHYISVLGLITSMVKISKNVKNIKTVNLTNVIQFLARRRRTIGICYSTFTWLRLQRRKDVFTSVHKNGEIRETNQSGEFQRHHCSVLEPNDM